MSYFHSRGFARSGCSPTEIWILKRKIRETAFYSMIQEVNYDITYHGVRPLTCGGVAVAPCRVVRRPQPPCTARPQRRVVVGVTAASEPCLGGVKQLLALARAADALFQKYGRTR